ncbi:cell division protein ZipA [Marinobacter halodurans]|uniref:Cell division protein ZipA n=1 Tax=Marinobacter halodurans TaxID=2528979 RepID=A0ABY1ZQC2_9GAMM|nr:cell division protein ZipA [Marinobacter halodurans]TBW59015.1 cell division protein ZipA [Marinobacter halodurans]
MSLREWLIAIGALIILGIVIDGLRRMRRARQEAAAISSGMGADDIESSPIDEEFNPELPNGGSRPITRKTLEERGYVRRSGKSRFAPPPQKPTRPVVADQPSHTAGDEEAPAGQPWQPSEMDSQRAEELEEPVEHMSAFDESPDGVEEPWEGVSRQEAAYDVEPEPEPPVARDIEVEEAPDPEEEVAVEPAPRPIKRDDGAPLAGANRPDAQEVIVINVLARQQKAFDGTALRKLFEGCGLEFGDMDIYHRHEESDTRSPVQFSVANAVEPGTFRDEDLDGMETPGISFFMSMPGPSDSLKAFEFMVETAQCVVHNLGGELKDERRSVMTPQTIEHCRQRIREFERKRRSQRVG